MIRRRPEQAARAPYDLIVVGGGVYGICLLLEASRRGLATLSDEYRVVFAVESVHDASGVIKFRQLSLQRLRVADDGSVRVSDLYSTSPAVAAGKLTVVGAARDPNSKRALFLTFQARPKAR